MPRNAAGKTVTRIALASIVTILTLSGVPVAAAEAYSPLLKTSDGLEVVPAAALPNVEFPMFAALDDRGRLFVAESSGGDLYDELQKQTRRCRIRLLEDTDGDGRYERSSVFADKLVFPMGLVWRDGKLYVADPPDLITLEDTDGDGVADHRSVVLSGFGHRDNGSLHGLMFGRDGWLYMTMGAPDGYRLRRSDGTALEGESGALIRCRADGKDPEVVARGFVNLVEVAFTPRGDIVGTDNWFQQPRGGLRDALVHVADGGLYPYEPDKGTQQPVTGGLLPAMRMYPAVAHSGVAFIEGAAFVGMQGNLVSA
jgi:glucose/arabinose dehydrogenase